MTMTTLYDSRANQSKQPRPVSRVDVLYTPDANTNKIAFAERVNVLYGNSSPSQNYGKSKQNGVKNDNINNHYQQFQFQNKFYRTQKSLSRSISYYECLSQLMTALATMFVLFSVLIPVCTIVLTALLGFEPIQIPGYLCLLFIVTVVCVFVARSDLNVNRVALYVVVAVMSALSIPLSIALIVVSIIGLNRDAPSPYGTSTDVHTQVTAVLAMECVIVSAGVIILIASPILLAIAIHFARGAYGYYHLSEENSPNSERSRTPNDVMELNDVKKPTEVSNSGVQLVAVAQLTNGDRPDSIQRAQTAPRTPDKQIRTPSQTSVQSVTNIEIEDPDDFIELPDTGSRLRSTRRWGKTKNVLKAIMDLKQ